MTNKEITAKSAIENYYYLIESGYGIPASTEGNGGAGYVYIDDISQLEDVKEENTTVFSFDEADDDDMATISNMLKYSETSLEDFDYFTITTYPEFEGFVFYMIGWFE
jgi:hypothetical protein